MKVSRFDRRVRSAVDNTIEMLEARQLLSATLVTAVPAKSLSLTQPAVSLTLSSYFDDSAVASGDTVVNLKTNLPSPYSSIPLELTTAATPNTVANFLKYITSGEYANSIFHRSVPGFVIQGGGYTTDGTPITSFGAIDGEYQTETVKNATPGTIAMALSTGPNSGTSEWFINLADNSELDTGDGGPFTAFGQTLYTGLTVANHIAALPIVDDTGAGQGAWNTLPVQNLSNGATVSSVPASDLVSINPVIVPDGLNFSATSSNTGVATTNISNGTLSLTPTGAGTTNITITATDLGGGTATSTFAVNVTAPTVPTVAIANASATIGSATQVVFPVTLSTASASAVTLSYTVTAGTAAASDFSVTGSTLDIPAGSTTANIPVDIVADSLGASENFTITLSGLSIDATFSGGGSTATATGTILPVVSTTVATTTTLQATSPSVAAGDTDTFVATITPASAGTAPTGTVTFSVGGTSIGTAGVTSGAATLTTTLSTPGDQSVTAVYGGSSSYNASTSNTLTINVSTLAPRITSNTLGSTVIAGVAVHGTVMIDAVNAISSIQNGIATFNLYASTSSSIDSDSVLIATVKKQVKLITGKGVTVPIQIKSLPASLTAGTYTLLAQTVDPSGNTSDAASGSSLTIATPVVTLTESIVKLVQPSAVVAGSKTTAVAEIQITNNGNVASTGTTTISLLASTDGSVAGGSVFKTVSSKVSIKPGKSAMLAVPLGAYPSVADGNYFIVAKVIDSAGISSSAVFTTPVNIAAAKIDLAASALVIPATAKIGKSVAVTLDLANNGNIAAVGILGISFSASSNSDGSDAFGLATLSNHINLKAGKSQVVHVKVPIAAGLAAGSVYLVAYIDPEDIFMDTDLTNNMTVSSTAVSLS